MYIGIDAGHGGKDKGTTAGVIAEADYALKIAQLVHMKTPETFLIRQTPFETLSLYQRKVIAQNHDADLVICLHVNDGPPEYKGAHAFHMPDDDFGAAVASEIMSVWPHKLSRKRLMPSERGGVRIAGAVEPVDDKLWPRVANVFRAYAEVPLILIEMFYATNKSNDIDAQDHRVIDCMVDAIFEGCLYANRAEEDINECHPDILMDGFKTVSQRKREV